MTKLDLLDSIRMYPDQVSAHKMRHHIMHSDPLGDDELQHILDILEHRNLRARKKETNAGKSVNLRNMHERELKMLENHEKYQRIWKSNLN